MTTGRSSESRKPRARCAARWDAKVATASPVSGRSRRPAAVLVSLWLRKASSRGARAASHLFYAFSSLSACTTICADADWGPPSGVSGMGRFYNSKLLVGGNGTVWSSSNTSYKYCVIDTASSPGYLTAG